MTAPNLTTDWFLINANQQRAVKKVGQEITRRHKNSSVVKFGHQTRDICILSAIGRYSRATKRFALHSWRDLQAHSLINSTKSNEMFAEMPVSAARQYSIRAKPTSSCDPSPVCTF